MRTRSQEMATCVFARIQRRSDGGIEPAAARKYATLAKDLPILVRRLGLAQTLAFVQDKALGQTDNAFAFNNLWSDLAHVLGFKTPDDRADRDAYATACRNAPLLEYMDLTERTISALDWFKRYAESVLDATPDARDSLDTQDVGEAGGSA